MQNQIFPLTVTASVLLLLAGVAFSQTPDAANPAASSAPTIKRGDDDGAFVIGSKFSEPTGEQIYRRVCAACHMPDAKGAVGSGAYPPLAANPKLAAAGYPVSVVLHGLNGMPPLGNMLTDQQIADVVNYLRTHFRNQYKDTVTSADVKEAR
jgi:mono/diheme cytochrome c family protein